MLNSIEIIFQKSSKKSHFCKKKKTIIRNLQKSNEVMKKVNIIWLLLNLKF